jgi:hypothetical protein
MSLEVDFHSWLVRLLLGLTSHFSLSLVLMRHLDCVVGCKVQLDWALIRMGTHSMSLQQRLHLQR